MHCSVGIVHQIVQTEDWAQKDIMLRVCVVGVIKSGRNIPKKGGQYPGVCQSADVIVAKQAEPTQTKGPLLDWHSFKRYWMKLPLAKKQV
jgi:hypothetical protein